MKTISLINQKGGVAKTTSCYNLAAAKAGEGKRVLMIDLDPQASLTISCGLEPGEDRFEGHSTIDLFDSKLDPLDSVFSVTTTKLETLYIVPADGNLSLAEGRFRKETYLRDALQKVTEYFDYVFIDCPPQLGKLTLNALIASDQVIVPCKVDYLSYRGLKDVLNTIQQIQDGKDNPNIELLGIIGTFYESRVKDQQDILDMIKNRGPVIGTVRKSADVARNLITGLPVVLSLPKSNTAAEYREIARRI